MRIGRQRPCAPGRGFTYLWLLFAIALAGAAAASLGERANVAAQRDKEAELVFRGEAIARAIAAYSAAASGSSKSYPQSLSDLVEDRRGAAIRRHLRRVYEDPFTGRADWELISGEDGEGIVGVHSRSQLPAFDVFGSSGRAGTARRRIAERVFMSAAPASQVDPPASAVATGKPPA